MKKASKRQWIGQRLVALREGAGMKKRHLALKIPIHQHSVKRWEEGMAPDADNIARLCAIFGVTPSFFFEDDEAGEGQDVVQVVREGAGDLAADMLAAFIALDEVSQRLLVVQAQAIARSQERAGFTKTSEREESSPTDLVPDPRSKSGGMIERGLLEKALAKEKEAEARVNAQKEHRQSSRPGR